MTKWEYLIVDDPFDSGVASVQELLNTYGSEGWELIRWNGAMIFKRPVTPPR